MLVIRLLRVGKKNQPFFKIIITDKSNPPRGGRFVEEVGTYNPLTKEKTLKKERIQYWLSQGVQPSDTVHNMLVREGILEGKKIPVHKKAKKKEEEPVKASKEEKPAEKKEDKPKEEKTEEKPKEESPKQEPKQEEVKKEEPSKEEPKKEKKKKEASEITK